MIYYYYYYYYDHHHHHHHHHYYYCRFRLALQINCNGSLFISYNSCKFDRR